MATTGSEGVSFHTSIHCKFQLLKDAFWYSAGLGRQMIHRWGYDRDEQAEITEQLHQLVSAQEEEDDWSD